ncbi:hypothetical protein H4217_009491, partial [Coemansia sp. RSA 1939]
MFAYEDDAHSLPPPPLDPPRLKQSGEAGVDNEYDSSDTDMSYLRTPQESGSEEEEEEEEEGEYEEEETGSYEEGEEEEEEVDEDGDEEMDDSLRGSRGLAAETNAVAHQPEYNSSNNTSIGSGYPGSNNIAALPPQQQQQQQPYEPENMYVPMASTSTAKGKQVAAASARAEDGDYGAPSRAASSSSRSRTSVYIQSSVDIDSAARYGEGYKHMNIDKHDDGSLVVATPEEAAAGAGAGASQSNNDGFMPALISAARRKREIQIVSFQNSVDAPNNAISGPDAGPPGSSAANVS